MVKLDLVYKYSFSFAFIEISKKNLAFLYKDKVFQFEILSFLIEFQVAHQKTRFFDRYTRFFDKKIRVFYGNTRFFKNMWKMASIAIFI